MNDFIVTRPSSIRGVAFHPGRVGESGGQNLIDHAYPNRDDHDHEKLGKKNVGFSVSGYISDIDERGDKVRQLRAALDDAASCTYYDSLTDEEIRVDIGDWHIDRSKEALGHIDFRFTALEVKPEWRTSPVTLASGTAQLQSLNSSLAVTLQDHVDAAVYPATSASDLQGFVDVIDLIEGLNFEPDRALFRATLRDFLRNTLIGTVGSDALTLLAALQQDTEQSARGFRLFNRLATTVIEPVSGVSGARQSQNKQRSALSDVLNLAAYKSLADVVVNHEYQDKSSAHALRFQFAQTGLALQSRFAEGLHTDLHNAVSEITAIVGREYENLTDALKPVAYYANLGGRSSLSLAWDLYQDPRNADDLIARNNVLSGSFLPELVEYLTP